MPRLSSPKAKGDAYEREVAAHFNAHLDPKVRLADFRRAPLSGGGVVDSGFDLTNTEIAPYGPRAGAPSNAPTRVFLGIEAKRTERLSLWEAWRQNARHAAHAMRANPNHPPIIPMVITRRNNVPTGDSLVVLSLDSLIQLLNGHVPPPGDDGQLPATQTTKRGPKPPSDPALATFDFGLALSRAGG